MKKRFLIPLISTLVALSALLVACGGGQPKSEASAPTATPSLPVTAVSVSGGMISGVLSDDGSIVSYKGIPYAAPPVNELRWEAPQLVIPWDGILACENFGNNPIQYITLQQDEFRAEFNIDQDFPQSEDCLTLNVWTNAESANQCNPVIVYIPGGGFVTGGSSCPIYDGEALARKNVVFVSINYRLGAMGFFAHPALSAASEYSASGNYGLMDMIAALKWVQENIAVFGGDPQNVTLMGQSAGGAAVNTLVCSPEAAGLFQKAVTASAAWLGRDAADLAVAEQYTASRFAQESLEGLRNMSASEITKKYGYYGSPVIDERYVIGTCAEQYSSSAANNVLMISGFVDGDIEQYHMRLTGSTEEDYITAIQTTWASHAEECLELYPLDGQNVQDALNVLTLDAYHGKLQYEAYIREKAGYGKTYLYFMDHPYPQLETVNVANHSDDLAYWFHNFADVRKPYLTEYDDTLADQMSQILVNFAYCDDPNGGMLPEWVGSAGTGEYLSLSDTVSAQCMSPERLAFWLDYYQSLYGY